MDVTHPIPTSAVPQGVGTHRGPPPRFLLTCVLGFVLVPLANSAALANPMAMANTHGGKATAGPVHDLVADERVDGKNYKLTIATPPCRLGAECAVELRLEPTGSSRIHETYPYKFQGTEGQGVEFLGKDTSQRSVFSRATGDFSQASPALGILTVRFKPTQAGPVVVTGRFRLALRSGDASQIEAQDITARVSVTK